MTKSERQYLAVIRNPTAGGARGARFAAVVAALEKAGCRVDQFESTSAADVRRLAARLSHGEHQALVVAGGDGTINDAVNGMVPGTPMPFGIVPLGTANVLAWEIGLAKARPAELAEALRCGKPRPIHMGRLFTGPELKRDESGADKNGAGKSGGRLFFLMTGAGFDASVVKGVNLTLKRRVGKLAYIWEAVRQLFIHDFPSFALEIDGKRYDAASVVVANAAHYGGSYLMAKQASLHVPAFQVCLFRRRGGLSVARYAVALDRGSLDRLPDFEVIEGNEVSIVTPVGAPLQLDGDPAGETPARIAPAAEQLNLIYPN